MRRRRDGAQGPQDICRSEPGLGPDLERRVFSGHGCRQRLLVALEEDVALLAVVHGVEMDLWRHGRRRGISSFVQHDYWLRFGFDSGLFHPSLLASEWRFRQTSTE
jgi:hypothetical protein